MVFVFKFLDCHSISFLFWQLLQKTISIKISTLCDVSRPQTLNRNYIRPTCLFQTFLVKEGPFSYKSNKNGGSHETFFIYCYYYKCQNSVRTVTEEKSYFFFKSIPFGNLNSIPQCLAFLTSPSIDRKTSSLAKVVSKDVTTKKVDAISPRNDDNNSDEE